MHFKNSYEMQYINKENLSTVTREIRLLISLLQMTLWIDILPNIVFYYHLTLYVQHDLWLYNAPHFSLHVNFGTLNDIILQPSLRKFLVSILCVLKWFLINHVILCLFLNVYINITYIVSSNVSFPGRMVVWDFWRW